MTINPYTNRNITAANRTIFTISHEKNSLPNISFMTFANTGSAEDSRLSTITSIGSAITHPRSMYISLEFLFLPVISRSAFLSANGMFTYPIDPKNISKNENIPLNIPCFSVSLKYVITAYISVTIIPTLHPNMIYPSSVRLRATDIMNTRI